MTTTTTPTSGMAIQRYKIGYHADEWGQRSSTPSGIPDASGSWVRYADHVTALAAGQATAAQAVVQDDLITIRKPTTSAEMLWLLKLAHLVISDVDKTLEETFAPAQPAQTGEARPVTPYTCPKCHALWLHWPAEQIGIDKDTLNCRSPDHCHYCETAGVEQLKRLERIPAALHAPQPSSTAQAADSVQEDAARYRWLREGNDAKHGAAWHVAVNLYGCEWDAAIDAAMNKGATQ